MSLHTLYIILQQTLIITTFVIGMMMVIEFINVRTGGLWSKKLQKSPWIQIIFAIVMGVIPGCLGTYTVVSLYVHRVVNFPALMAALITTTGDEAFFMFSLFPEKALLINLILITIAIIVATILQFSIKNKFIGLKDKEMSFPIHEHESCSHSHHHHHSIKKNIKNISFVRALLITLSLGVLTLVLSGIIDGSHHLSSFGREMRNERRQTVHILERGGERWILSCGCLDDGNSEREGRRRRADERDFDRNRSSRAGGIFRYGHRVFAGRQNFGGG